MLSYCCIKELFLSKREEWKFANKYKMCPGKCILVKGTFYSKEREMEVSSPTK